MFAVFVIKGISNQTFKVVLTASRKRAPNIINFVNSNTKKIKEIQYSYLQICRAHTLLFFQKVCQCYVEPK